MELTTLFGLELAELLQIILWLLPFALVLIVNESIDRITSWPREVHRKFGHVCSGLVVIASTYALSLDALIVFGSILIVSALLTYVYGFRSVHGVERKTIGTFLFPFSFVVLLIACGEQHMEYVRYGMWILTVPDALAALVGSQWGTQIPRFNKSLLGSGVFFLSLFVVTLLVTSVWWVSLVLALVLTAVEFVSQWGTDNISLPLAGAFLLLILL